MLALQAEGGIPLWLTKAITAGFTICISLLSVSFPLLVTGRFHVEVCEGLASDEVVAAIARDQQRGVTRPSTLEAGAFSVLLAASLICAVISGPAQPGVFGGSALWLATLGCIFVSTALATLLGYRYAGAVEDEKRSALRVA